MNAFSKRLHWALVGACTLISCSHEGVGTGVLEKPGASAGGEKTEGPVEFVWRSGTDPSQGQIDAITSDERRFVGTYIQPRARAWLAAYGPYWDVWTNRAWGVPDPWFNGTQDAFVTTYSGKALAHLTSTDGTRMRCVFLLRDPAAGMAGGGEGDCQLSTHERVFGARLHSD
jgi:hypothetical protein